jgi:hypothetical protein
VTGVLRVRVGGQWVDIPQSGPAGPPGPAGGTYVHNQGVSAASWIVEHDLGYFPNVTVIDSGGTEVEGDIAHIDQNTVTLSFSAAFSGTAYLS